MSDGTAIEWADASWQPVTGCARVSPGCGTSQGGCYAERMAWRLSHNPATPQYKGTVRMTEHGPRWTGVVRPNEGVLLDPLKWRKHRRIFIASMSDLFHDDVPDSHLDLVFATVLACQYLENRTAHQFMALTKRDDRMRDYFSAGAVALLKRWSAAADGRIIVGDGDVWFSECVEMHCQNKWDNRGLGTEKSSPWSHHENLFPLRNLMLGVSVEDRKRLPRIDNLRATPAHRRFVSLEPLLEDLGVVNFTGIHLAIIGGESGAGSRPFDLAWGRSLVKQCREHSIDLPDDEKCYPFFKQAGANRILGGHRIDPVLTQIHAKKGNGLAELPEDLRVREWCPR